MTSKCDCFHCGCHIEFDANEFIYSSQDSHRRYGQSVACPHCGKSTHLYLPRNSATTAAAALSIGKRQESRAGKTLLIVGGGLFLLVVCLLAFMFREQAGAATGGLLGGIFGTVLLVLGIILVAFWVIFPWMVYYQSRQIQRVLEQIRDKTP